MKGTIKFFNTERGFGFIKSEDGRDYFVHYSEIQMEGFKVLREGDEVEFSPAEDPKGRTAKNVRKTKEF